MTIAGASTDPWAYALAAWEEPETPPWVPLPHQVPPPGEWYLWLLQAGRGAGKTDACAVDLDAHVNGPPCDKRLPGGHRVAIIAPTLGDALDACVNGPSGLKAHNPGIRSVQTTGGTFVRWPNGAEGKLFGADGPGDVERLRAGGNRCRAWLEEMAAWRYLEATWTQMRLGLRLGSHAAAVASTTPKNRLLIRAINGRASAEETKKLLGEPPVPVAITRASTDDNPHLDPGVRKALYDTLDGTRMGRQELHAELLEDIEGALWQSAWIDAHRIAAFPHAGFTVRTVVAIDPADGLADGDEQAVVVASKGNDGRYYVQHSDGMRVSPSAYIGHAAELFRHFKADRLVYEKNHGGRYLTELIQKVAPDLPVRAVDATQGKRTRAEPISALYEQGRVTHVGRHDKLEDQMTSYTGAAGERSPDRLDACIAAGTLVKMASGDVPIEQVRPGDMAWTRAGWRPVLFAGQTAEAAAVVRLRTTAGELVLTPDHRVFVFGKGFQRADALVWGDRVSACPSTPSPSFMTAARSVAVLIRQLARAGFTTRRGPTRTGASVCSSFTSRCGEMRMAAQRFRRATSSTTGTTTRSTTTPPTCNASLVPNMAASTASGATTSETPPTSQLSGSWLLSGTAATRAGCGTESTAPGRGRTETLSRPDARSAMPPTSHRSLTAAGSAPGHAYAEHPTRNTDTSGRSPARSAAPSSGKASTGPSRPPVLARVLGVSAEPLPTPVHDLTVADQPEFFAAGLLVHNCVWALTDLAGGAGRPSVAKAPRRPALGEGDSGSSMGEALEAGL